MLSISRSLASRVFRIRTSLSSTRYSGNKFALTLTSIGLLSADIPFRSPCLSTVSTNSHDSTNNLTIISSVMESRRELDTDERKDPKEDPGFAWFQKSQEYLHNKMSTEGGRTVTILTAANVGVYLLWKALPTKFMIRHFVSSLDALKKRRVWTNFTSNFSHMGMFHLGANMYLLNKFGEEVANLLGQDRFFIFYITAGVASSLASLAYRQLTRSPIQSLGASGAVVATLWLNACFFPDRRMRFPFLEDGLTMQELVLMYSIFDAAGLFGSLGLIDFAAHLGGAVFGNIWFHMMRDQLVREQSMKRIEKST